MRGESVVLLLATVGGTALALAAAVLLMRGLLIVRTRHEARSLGTWEPILIEATVSVPSVLPRLARSDTLAVLTLWNHLQESVVGDASERLNQLARQVGIPSRAARMLRRGSLRERLTAIVTLGRLRERSAWPLLCTYAGVAHVPLSLAAARALVHVDPAAAATYLMPLVLRRADWPAARVATLLTAIGPDLVSQPLSEAALAAPPEHAPRLIRYLDVIHAHTAIPAVRRIIQLTNELEVITACLRVLESPEDLETVRGYCEDPRWEVRVQAASALGRIGVADDLPRLRRLLADHEWWVRHRAAHALCRVLADQPHVLDQVQESHYNPFARDALTQARAERRLA